MNERELFEKWAFNNGFKMGRDDFDDYENTETFMAYEAWQASANREGYKLVPVEMSWEKADELASAEWDKNKTLFKSQCTDLSVVQVEQFRLRWCKNKAHQIMSDYKKVVGAVE